MVRSVQEVDWYSNINTGHNIVILKKKSGTQQPFGPIGDKLAACTVQFNNFKHPHTQNWMSGKSFTFQTFFTPIHTIHTYHKKRNGLPLNYYEVHILTTWVQQLNVQVEMHISTAPCVNNLTCSKLFFNSRCVVPTFTASLTVLHCTEVVLVTTTSTIVEWCTSHMIWIIVPSLCVVVAFPRRSRQ